MSATAAPAIALDMPDAEYRQAPGLSSTGIKHLLDSPARYQWERTHRTDKRAFDLGHVVHSVILGAGLDVEVIDAPDWRTKDAREQRDTARAAGHAPILRHEWEQVALMRDAVLAHDDARALLEAAGHSEVSLFWDDEETGTALKGRVDRLPDAPVILDLKAGRTADPRKFGKHAADFGYGEQAVHYREGVERVRGEQHRFIHVVVESDAPHLVSVIELDHDFMDIAAARRRAAIYTYAHCVTTGEWPGFPAGIVPVRAPRWYAAADIDPEEYAS